MIILGDISGIQNYLFDVAEEGGGQAQRLRARSFFMQLLSETAALRVLRGVGWPLNEAHILLSGAGKFLLRGPGSPGVDEILAGEQEMINCWLLRETRGELSLTLAWADSAGSDAAMYNVSQENLQRTKARAWAPVQGGSWAASRLLLSPLDTPCSLCGHAPALEAETDRDTGQVRRVCHTCAANRQLGQRLPRASWLIIHDTPQSADFELLGFGITVMNEGRVSLGPEVVAVANLDKPNDCPSWCPEERFLRRRLMAHVPTDEHGCPVWFTELAQQAQGDRLLAVLKADADSLGVLFHRLLHSTGLEAMADFSEQLDAFFAGRLKQEITNNRDRRWQWIYTIFAGGDDLIMVGPWDVLLDFAGRLHELFAEEFRSHGLTLSAGVVLIKPKRPIKTAVAEAERLLEQAKTRIAPDEVNPKDQCAAFGQVWKWKHHTVILKIAKQLTSWVDAGQMQRGWLHTLLELSEARHGANPNFLATSRLAYHVDRNYRQGSDARCWAEALIKQFDDPSHVEVRYLPAIVRWALAATRKPGEEE